MGTATRARTAAPDPSATTAPASRGGPGAVPPAGPVTPRPVSRPGHLGPLRLQQLVLAEVAAALLLVAWAVDALLLVPAAVVSGALLLFAVMRRHQRSLPEWLGGVLALRRRRRRAASAVLPPDTDPVLAPVVECEPALRTYTHTGREHRRVGMIGDGTFVTAVLRIEAGDSALRPQRTRHPLPLGMLYDVLEVDGIRLASAQLVQHTQPAPAPHLPEQSVAARNYLPLQAQTGSPAVRLTWVALKLDPELCPEAVAARGGGLTGAQRSVLRCADQLASRLTGAGFRATVLSEEELVSAVSTSLCANPMATAQAGRAGAPGRRTAESSRVWRCDDRRHTTYWLGRWPAVGAGAASLPQLVALLTSVPALATTFSLTLRRGGRQEAALSAHLRVTGRSDNELVRARHEVQRAARGVGIGLIRLDREQLPGVLTTLPLGGTR
ncbi:type VII secretion protein EccE [Streptomyces albus]|uniref:type VII secretion protein EccE n=1 Tax=Streptomyces albus TaxID=1888 RepID=UPI0004C563A0|nr:type VII secretion protein EccE [Streptomyces albus]